jgi:hypothetical protein
MAADRVIRIIIDEHRDGSQIRSETFAEPVIVIGRDPAAHVRIDDPSVAATHVMIETTSDEARLQSLGAATFVNGSLVERCLLCDGDELRLGHTTLRLSLGEVVERPQRSSASASSSKIEGAERERASSVVREDSSSRQRFDTSAFDTSAFDERGATVVELSIWWKDSLLRVAHVEAQRRFVLADEASRARSGEELRFVASLDAVASSRGCVIVDPIDGGWRFVFLPGSRGEVVIDGVASLLEALVVDRTAVPSAAIEGAHEVALRPGARYTMELGALTVRARLVPRGRAHRGPRQTDARWRGALVASILCVSGSLCALRVAASDEHPALSRADEEARMSYLRGLVDRHQGALRERPVREEALDDLLRARLRYGPESCFGSTRSCAERDARSMQALRERGALGSRGVAERSWSSSDSTFAALALSSMELSHSSAMMVGYGAGRAEPSMGWGSPFAIPEKRGPLASVMTQPSASLITLGSSDVYQCPPSRALSLRFLQPEVTGSLSPERVRAVLSQRRASIVRCHELSSGPRPTAQGRVVLRFVIGGDGRVLGAMALESESLDASASQCMVNEIRRLVFPSPARGVVTVDQPMQWREASRP